MTSEPTTDRDIEILDRLLSRRARRAGAAYSGPGAGETQQPVRPPIRFTAGIPDPEALPVDDLIAASEAALRRDGIDALEYGGTQGFGELREWLASHFGAGEGLPLTPAHFSLTNGSAEALVNVCETFVDEDDVVCVESPSFPGSIRAIRSFGPRVEGIPVDAEGKDVEALAAMLARLEREGQRAKLVYTIASYHNPTGTTLSLERRQKLLALCAHHGARDRR